MGNPGLYIHIPFCRSKCPYCAFHSLASSSLIPRLLKALKNEISHYRDCFGEFDSLYMGGGTPTFLKLRDLSYIMETLFSCFDFTRDTEFTIEANPCDLTGEKTKSLRDLGFNRISLGIQSFEDDVLSFLGRYHSAEQAKRALMDVRSAGFENIGVDLIYGFEGQNLEGWIKTLKQAVAFGPEHLSCYQLTFERKTLFGGLYEKGILRSLGEEEERLFFLTTSDFLKNHGYIHYEVSNFAKSDSLVSRHNCKYWHHIPYLGLGPSAHSFQNTTRWWNVRSVKRYCEFLENGRIPIEGYEALTDDQMKLEEVSLGLRTNQGLDLDQIPANPKLADVLFILQDSGFLKIVDNRILPTTKGFLVADRLPLYLI